MNDQKVINSISWHFIAIHNCTLSNTNNKFKYSVSQRVIVNLYVLYLYVFCIYIYIYIYIDSIIKLRITL